MSETTITPQEWAKNWLSNLEYYLRNLTPTLALLFLDFRLDYDEGYTDATRCPIFYAQKDAFVNLLARQYAENPEVFKQSLLVFDDKSQTLSLAGWFLALLQKSNAEQEAEQHIQTMPLGLEQLIFSGDHPPIIPTEGLEEETIVGNETLVGPSPTEAQT